MSEKSVVEDIGKQIRALRREKGLPQEKIAYAARIEQTQLSKMERGIVRPTPTIARRLALALELDEGAFLTDV